MSKDEEYKAFSDYYQAIVFYADTPKRALVDILDKSYLIRDCLVVRGFRSKYGTSDFALLLMRDLETQEEFTTLCGGEVVVRKLDDAMGRNLLPLWGTIIKPGHYYDII